MAEHERIQQKESSRTERLWTPNFFLLWQGQLVSAVGDVVYDIALGFWILAVTGSTALMGTLMAASVLPRVVVSPFAGAFVDRTDRKKLLVLMDLIRGVSVVLLSVAAFSGFIEIWMVFAVGVVLGTCGAFFNPAIGSSLPDIVPKSCLIKANSYFRMIHTGAGIVGSSMGGILFQTLGAPVLFLLNGISYILSSVTELFVKIPEIEKTPKEVTFREDLREGFAFVWHFRGLRYLVLIAAFVNFFATMAIVLMLPFFERTPGLGPVKYGLAMAFLTGGMLAGMLLTSLINVPSFRRSMFFSAAAMGNSIAFMFFPLISSFTGGLALLAVAGVCNAILNIMYSSVIQLTVPQNKRGKVFGLMGTITQGLTPIAIALGGVLAEFIEIRVIMVSCWAMSLVLFLPFGFMDCFRRFMNFDPDTHTIAEVM